MVESSDEGQGKKKITKIKTFPVPFSFSLEEDKDSIAIPTNSNNQISQEQIISRAIQFHLKGNIPEATKCYQYCINQDFNDPNVFLNYGTILQDLGKLKEAELSIRKSIKIKPDFAEAHSNLGIILNDIGKLQEAELSIRKAIEINPDFAEAHLNLGNILRDLGKLQEAELSTRKAIEINPNFANSHLNLGNILRDLGNLKKAEISTRKAIELNPNSADGHSNLGSILIDLGKLKEAKISLHKAIAIKSDYFIAYLNLSICLYLLKDISYALKITEAAKGIKPNNKDVSLLSNILNSLDSTEDKDLEIETIRSNFFKKCSDANLFISNRPVEKELIESLYQINARDAKNKNKYQPVIFGNTRGSNFNLFENRNSNIQKLKEEITNILKNNLKSNIFIKDSFVTIFKSGGGVITHNHIGKFDNTLRFIRRKFSLVYYLSIGDQECEDPGMLKLHNPKKNILPTNGMIIVFPADRLHSASYSGTKDRIVVGVNFYII